MTSRSEQEHDANRQAVVDTPGLIAYWDFEHTDDDVWASRFDPEAASQSFPVYLRQIGDPVSYSLTEWPYREKQAAVQRDASGPFGSAVRFNRGHIYGAVPREAFDQTPLDLNGRRPFTLMAWIKFVGERHMVAGIWDEGGWHKYGGRRQVALFAGLFRQRGVIGHVSATGAASFPQSNLDGAQYARVRAIDGRAFKNDEWVTMAMTHDPDVNEVRAFLNGAMTPLTLADPIAHDVYRYSSPPAANPLAFEKGIYSPRSFALKYNGYSMSESSIREHRVLVDLTGRTLTYQRDEASANVQETTHRVVFRIERMGESLLTQPLVMAAVDGQTYTLPLRETPQPGDEIVTRLERLEDGSWEQVGTELRVEIAAGAPFTFGRALGLDSEVIEHGSQLYVDGVAVFERVLADEELERLSFSNGSAPD